MDEDYGYNSGGYTDEYSYGYTDPDSYNGSYNYGSPDTYNSGYTDAGASYSSSDGYNSGYDYSAGEYGSVPYYNSDGEYVTSDYYGGNYTGASGYVKPKKKFTVWKALLIALAVLVVIGCVKLIKRISLAIKAAHQISEMVDTISEFDEDDLPEAEEYLQEIIADAGEQASDTIGEAIGQVGDIIDEVEEAGITAEGIIEQIKPYIPSSDDPLYNTILNGALGYITDIDLGNIDEDTDVGAVVRDLLNDHPEIFWLDGAGEWSGTVYDTYSDFELKLEPICPIYQIPQMTEELNAVVETIVDEASTRETDMEKALYVHNYIIQFCAYDEDTYAEYLANPDTPTTQAYTAYGCLVEGNAVCQGYAKAFQLVMNKLGIECGLVWGTGTDSEGNTGSHAWNYIKLDGEYYMVDVTWDDPVGYIGKCRKDYFCLSKEEMSEDHVIDSDCKLPW